jgi:hypothetical protein
MRIGITAVGLLAICVAPSAGGDVLWDNGSFDGRNGLSSNWCQGTWTADDFIVTDPVRIERATAEFYVRPPADGPFERADVAVWAQPIPGEGPEDLLVELDWLPISSQKIGEGFGYDIIAATVEGLDIELEPGDYFFTMRLAAIGGMSWLATTGDGVLKGRDAGWFHPDHPPFWYPVRDYMGYDTDFAFRLEGIPEPATAMLLLLGLAAMVRPRVATYTA